MYVCVYICMFIFMYQMCVQHTYTTCTHTHTHTHSLNSLTHTHTHTHTLTLTPQAHTHSLTHNHAHRSVLHAIGNVGGNVAFGAGALGFAHVLKSCEPAFTAIFSGVIPECAYLKCIYVHVQMYACAHVLRACLYHHLLWCVSGGGGGSV